MLLRTTASLALLLAGCAEAGLTFERDGQAVVELDVRFAITADERRRGLQGGSLMNHEALVIWPPGESELCITNRNVTFPIHAIYVGSDDIVTEVASFGADEEALRCVESVRYVVEIREGSADVRIGDRAELNEEPR